MSMEVSGNYKDYTNDYFVRRQQGEDKTKEIEKEEGAGNKSERIPVPKDEYISSEQSGRRPSGLYHIEKDENGNPKVLYDDPKKAAAEKCTTNTDKVDREIEKLKGQKQQLEQQIKADSENEEKVKALKKKLSQIESELNQKDNDTYRRQNAMIF